MNRSSSSSRLGFFLNTKSPDPGDFETLLNLLPDAALIIDQVKRLAVHANSAFIQLSLFSQNEIRGMAAKDLLQGIESQSLQVGSEYELTLTRRNREPRDVKIKIAAQLSDGLLVVSIVPTQIRTGICLEEQVDLLHQLYELNRQADGTDIHPVLTTAVDLVCKITGADRFCLYQADAGYPRLKRIGCNTAAENFPETISSADLARLSHFYIWRHGLRVSSELHKAGKVAKLSYVATAPLGDAHGYDGLIVVADSRRQPAAELERMMTFIADLIYGILQKHVLFGYLSQEIERLKAEGVISQSLFSSSVEGVVVLLPDMTVKRLNPAAEALLGYTEWEARGQQVENILVGAEGLYRAVTEAFRGMPTPDMGSLSIHRRDGTVFPAHVQTLPVQENGEITAVMVLIVDISADEQIRLRTQQLEHRAVLGEFTAIFAHEVRNPINNISTGLQLIASRVQSEDPNYDTIQRMLGDCARLDHLMESVLSFSRPMENTFHPIDISQLLQRITDRWHPRFARSNVQLHFQPVQDLPKVLGDLRSLEQVFTNLISNAVDAMGKNGGGMLAVRMHCSDVIPNRPQIEVTISDNGPGIPDDIRDRIFEPFVTINSPKGTGLGLAITKRIITAHQGSVSVTSFPGGTVFHVFLPVIVESGA